MSRIVHFEVPADNPERAQKFYAQALGWEFTAFGGPMPYWLVKTGPTGAPGIDGGLLKRGAPGQGPMVIAGVASIDTSIEQVKKAGGTQVVDKMAIPGVGYAAYFLDTEGNCFGIFQDDVNAK
ncbi:MAG TPA: VOC family protein [Candidatus Krumholzibacteria bacterium]|nr:VOC family protein [Candidatus Krumholzibacteria bacterium]